MLIIIMVSFFFFTSFPDLLYTHWLQKLKMLHKIFFVPFTISAMGKIHSFFSINQLTYFENPRCAGCRDVQEHKA